MKLGYLVRLFGCRAANLLLDPLRAALCSALRACRRRREAASVIPARDTLPVALSPHGPHRPCNTNPARRSRQRHQDPQGDRDDTSRLPAAGGVVPAKVSKPPLVPARQMPAVVPRSHPCRLGAPPDPACLVPRLACGGGPRGNHRAQDFCLGRLEPSWHHPDDASLGVQFLHWSNHHPGLIAASPSCASPIAQSPGREHHAHQQDRRKDQAISEWRSHGRWEGCCCKRGMAHP